jgi:hypothetical protein
MIPITIKLTLETPLGPAGHRLERAVPLPINQFSFPDTPEGRIDAEKAKVLLQNYVDKHVIPELRK